MAYSELPWRPFLGHQAWSWTTLRRGNVFLLRLQTFFLSHFYVLSLNVFYIYGSDRFSCPRCCSLALADIDRYTVLSIDGTDRHTGTIPALAARSVSQRQWMARLWGHFFRSRCTVNRHLMTGCTGNWLAQCIHIVYNTNCSVLYQSWTSYAARTATFC